MIALKISQPWAYRKLEIGKPVLPDVHMGPFLQRESKTWRAMLKHCRRDDECRLAVDEASG